MASDASSLPLKPLPPSDDDCCHGECAPHCVFDDYERQLERWQLACEQLRQAQERGSNTR